MDMNRAIAVIAGSVVIVVVSVVGLALVQSVVADESAATVGREGQIAIHAEASLSAAAAVRNALTQAAIVSDGVRLGLVDQERLVDARASISRAIDEFSNRASSLAGRLEPTEASAVSAVSTAFTDASIVLWEAIELGNPDPSVVGSDGQHAASFASLTAVIVEVRDQRVQRVLIAADAVGIAADAVRFLVIFVVPLSAMVVFKRSMRRRRERDVLEAELAKRGDVIAAKDQFVANLSHGLRTPLTSIYGFAHALTEVQSDEADVAAEITGYIIDESAQLGRMVDDLIAAGQIDSSGIVFLMEDHRVVDLVKHAIEPFEIAGATIDFSKVEGQVHTDGRRFEQILTNLISNAVKHGGGTVRISTLVSDSHVRTSVADTGMGIDPDNVDALFSRYVHGGDTPLLVGSVGMGLAVAQALAVEMGGTLEYRRTPDTTVFEITLPRSAAGKDVGIMRVPSTAVASNR